MTAHTNSAKGHLFRTTESDEYYFREGCYILERLNHPTDPQASIARARVPAGGATLRHRLANTTECYLVLEGQGEVQLGERDALTVGPGDVVVIPADTPQQIANVGTSDLVFLAICTPRFVPENYREG